MQVVNVAAYKFIAIPHPAQWQVPVQDKCAELDLKGTVLLAEEGINFSLAGTREAIDTILEFFRTDPTFEGRLVNLETKESLSDAQPFGRMLVRLPREIITMRHPTIRPEGARAPAVAPATLKAWLDKGCDDEGRQVVLLDTRNNYEVEVGTFKGAVDLNIETFGQFPDAIKATTNDDKYQQDQTIVSFCTGGIRCEKAALYMQEIGFPRVFQLEGGILRYFEEIGGDHWQGECFVFDERGALNPSLKESEQHSARRKGKTN